MSTAKVTIEDLRTRLEEEHAEAEAAKAALGAAVLDAADPRKASKRVVDAEAAVTRTEAAIEEVERREAVQAEHNAAVATAEENLRIYYWIGEYMARAEAVLHAAEKLKAAEADLLAHRPTSNALYRFVSGLDRKLDHEVPFDADMARRVRYGRQWPARTAEELLKSQSIDSLQEARERALKLAQVEQSRLDELEAG